MKSKIDETLKKMAEGTSKANSPNTSSTDQAGKYRSADADDQRLKADLPGDPNCPLCHGVGYLRRDLPINHPDFGKLETCSCRQGQISRHIHQRLFALSNLDSLRHLTFDNFKLRGDIGLRPLQADSLELAYNQARRFAQSLNGWLLLQGGYGCGKTHLAAAIANFAVEMGVPTLFITAPDLLDRLRFSYDDPAVSFEERFDEFTNAPLLVLDDFGTQNATAWAQEKLFQILNHRYINRQPLVVTTNLPLEDIEERIRSRLQDSNLVNSVRILAPDYRRSTDDAMHVLHRMTFAGFDPRKTEGLPSDVQQSLETALQAAQDFARSPHGWMLLLGGYGCGKTHLAAAIANYRDDLGLPQAFISVPDFLDHLRAAFSPNSAVSLDRRFEEVRKAPFLILDDLGTHHATPWAQEKLFQLFNYRYNVELPTVITSPNQLEDMEPRLRSRLLDTRLCEIFAITAPSYRGVKPKEKPAVRRKRRTV